jgi:hypothetical protein
MYEVFEQLLQKHGVTPYKVAKEAGVTQTALIVIGNLEEVHHLQKHYKK